jgi:hypothetical protein
MKKPMFPVVSIPGSGTRSVKRNAALLVAAQALLPSCDNSSTVNSGESLNYVWTVYAEDVLDSSLVSTRSSSVDFASLQLAVRRELQDGGDSVDYIVPAICFSDSASGG